MQCRKKRMGIQQDTLDLLHIPDLLEPYVAFTHLQKWGHDMHFPHLVYTFYLISSTRLKIN